MTARGGVAARGVAASLVGAVLLVDLWRAVRYPVLHGDSAGLVVGARHVVDCVHHRVFTSCQTWAGGQRNADGTSNHVGPWPLLQYIPAVALRAVRVSRESTLRALVVLDALALWALLALVWHTLRRTVAAVWAPVLVLGLLASPLLWYGTAAFGEALAATVVVAAVAATVTLRRGRPEWRGVAPLLVAVALVLDIAGLATWYSPFGWVAWGPRLLLTLVPAMLLVSCVFADDRATAWLRHFLTSIWLWPAAVLTVVLALPQATVLYNARVIGQFFGGRDPHCVVDAHVGTDARAYYRCFDYVAWRKQPFMLQRGLEGWHATGGKVFALLYVAALVALVLRARGRAHEATALDRAKEPVSV